MMAQVRPVFDTARYTSLLHGRYDRTLTARRIDLLSRRVRQSAQVGSNGWSMDRAGAISLLQGRLRVAIAPVPRSIKPYRSAWAFRPR